MQDDREQLNDGAAQQPPVSVSPPAILIAGKSARAGSSPPADVVANVGERLVRFRVQAGFELEDAAVRTRIDLERLADAEAGELALTDAEIATLAQTYGVDATEIFGGRITPIRNIAAG